MWIAHLGSSSQVGLVALVTRHPTKQSHHFSFESIASFEQISSPSPSPASAFQSLDSASS